MAMILGIYFFSATKSILLFDNPINYMSPLKAPSCLLQVFLTNKKEKHVKKKLV